MLTVDNSAFEDVSVRHYPSEIFVGSVYSLQSRTFRLCRLEGRQPTFIVHAIGGRWDRLGRGEGLQPMWPESHYRVEVGPSQVWVKPAR